ncbi:PRC-barrel domain-containing protein [Blastococcus sp. BMG 814]|uniref:PRC-barrel domain-containing protein n=1 Tax=Blastococcus carthaginiensis TaxID=3050034 RepID=A0ABT9IE56_9ACTN|nr:PRC-barrel domain-containing protein [Blastococcus carthaginiensis]MDP5183385.1 PRC-barrel domain-containing protein [Blastococcus carthaginiensis]
MTDDIGRLVRLGDTAQTVADPAADVRGRAVVDSDGDDVGRVDDLLVDDQENEVRFLRIGEGGFLGIGAQHYLIPVDAVVAVEPDRIRISRNRDRMAEVPPYDPELEYQPDYYAGVYGWWGYAPFWGPGYRYPTYPRY